MENVACNLCGSGRQTLAYEMPDHRFFPQEVFQVVECADCGLGFVNPRPTPQEIAKYYPPEYFQSPGTQSFDRYLAKRFSREAAYIEEARNGASPGTLLDVGCANGEFPRFMAARGWQVEGAEVAPSAQPITDFPVYLGDFKNIPVDKPTYDVVTAWAVLEHVHDPMACFRKASQLVKKDGLFIFLVPNFRSITSRYLFWEDIPRHLYFFSRSTVRTYLEKTGFALQKEDNRGNVYKASPANWLQFVLQTKLRGKSFTWQDVPLSSRQFRKVHGLRPGVQAALKYAAYSPLSTIDRMLWPFIEWAQILRGTYGNTTYIARKL